MYILYRTSGLRPCFVGIGLLYNPVEQDPGVKSHLHMGTWRAFCVDNMVKRSQNEGLYPAHWILSLLLILLLIIYLYTYTLYVLYVMYD